MSSMYIVAIAWLYVVLMMSITERTAVAGVMTFLLYGVLPLTIVLYLMGTPQRKRNRQLAKKNQAAAETTSIQAASDAEPPPSNGCH
jgi:biotin transporter BioY